MADAVDSKSTGSDIVRVQIPSPALNGSPHVYRGEFFHQKSELKKGGKTCAYF